LQRIRLNVEEVEASGQPVQDDVTSPRIGGRDFVSERLELDRRAAALEAEAASTLLRDVRRRQDVGLAGEVDVLQVEAEAARAVNVLQAVQETLALRGRFLEGGLTVEEATRQRMLLLARSELRSAEQALVVETTRHDRLESQFELGLVREVDLLEARLAMLSTRQDVTTLRNRIQMLESGGR
jgi:outer membrane protein TolC